jgi:uncharacterized protein YjaG (DUF416 family)
MNEGNMKQLLSERGYGSWVSQQLAELQARHRAAFAAAAAERQFGTYVHFARQDPRMSPDTLRIALDTVWAYAGGEVVTVAALEEAAKEVELLIPDLADANAMSEAILVLDAAAAVQYAVRSCLTGKTNDAMAAGQCAKDAVHEWVDRTLRPGLAAISSRAIEAVQKSIDQHPLMVRELQSVRQALELLRQQPEIDRTVCSQLKRAWANGKKSNIDLE